MKSESVPRTTNIPRDYTDTVASMEAAQALILEALDSINVKFDEYPDLEGLGRRSGIAAAKSFAIQGILKYHGMTDWDWRIAYMPSISVNNDAAYSLTIVEFDPGLKKDLATIGGLPLKGRALERVIHTLNVVREFAGIHSHARVTSKNVIRDSAVGKGLGISAAASAALATAAIAAVFGRPMVKNTRLVSCLSRLLAGSGCRSAAGGAAVWLSYPGISHEDSFAVRIDNNNELADLSLITIPVASRTNLKTESAHTEAPHSPFFRPWMYSRSKEILECIGAIQKSDWQTLGQLSELDSIRLHSVTMSANRNNKIIAWEPETITLFHLCNAMRSDGIPVYFSTDTGPTTVLLTHKHFAKEVARRLTAIGVETIHGSIAGPATLVDVVEARKELAISTTM